MDGGPFETWPGEFPAALKPGQLLVSARQPVSSGDSGSGDSDGGGMPLRANGAAGSLGRGDAADVPTTTAVDGDSDDECIATANARLEGGGVDDGGDDGRADDGVEAGPLGPTDSELAVLEGDGRVLQTLQLRSEEGGASAKAAGGLRPPAARVRAGALYRFRFAVMLAGADGAETATVRARMLSCCCAAAAALRVATCAAELRFCL